MPDTCDSLTDGRPRDDRSLIERVIAGDPQALRVFVDSHIAVVRAFLIRRMRLAATDADDITQQVFEKLCKDGWQALRQWRGGGLAAYLKKIAYHLAVDFLRARGREVPIGDDPPDEGRPEVDVVEPGPENDQFRRELQQAINACLERLQARDRKLMELYLRGATYQEIGAQLRMTVNAVGVALHRAEARLRKCLEQLHPGLKALFATG